MALEEKARVTRTRVLRREPRLTDLTLPFPPPLSAGNGVGIDEAGKSKDQRKPSGPARPDTFPPVHNLCEEHRAGNHADRDTENGIQSAKCVGSLR